MQPRPSAILGILAVSILIPACGTGGGGTLTPTVAPAVPTDLVALTGNQRITLRWIAPTAGVAFTVWRASNSGGPYFPISSPAGSPTPTSYVDSGLTNGSRFFYRVTASNQFGESAPSEEVMGSPAFAPAVIAAGLGDHSLAVFEDGSVWAWGPNTTAQMGNGTRSGISNNPAEVTAIDDVASAAAGNGHSLALRSDGTVWGWGLNSYAQTGIGSPSVDPVLLPVPVVGLSNVSAISAGTNHNLALRHDGTVWGWGRNDFGQAGTGLPLIQPVAIPVQVPSLSGITAVSAGALFSAALRNDGTVWTWGSNLTGQLGNDSMVTSSPDPVQVFNLNGVIAIAAGHDFCLAVRDDGSVWAWGNNIAGQLGNGEAPTPARRPKRVLNLAAVTSVSGGFSHGLALQRDGTLWAWGRNYQGVLGTGPLTGDSDIPVQVVGIDDVSSISAGDSHNLARRTDGSVWSWGTNEYGQLGAGAGTIQDIPVLTENFTEATAVSAGSTHTQALRTGGSLWVFGANDHGQRGNGTIGGTDLSPAEIPAFIGATVTATAAGTYHGLALLDTGKVWGWGENARGQAGNGNASIQQVPTPSEVVGLTGLYVSIAAGDDHSLAVRDDGTVWGWGDNTFGSLGNGATSASPVATAVQVLDLTNVKSVAAGWHFSLALKNDGTVWAWGHTVLGQMGSGAGGLPPAQTTPLQVLNLSGIDAIACGRSHGMALRDDGTVWAWGSNSAGQLGDGSPSPDPVHTPFQVASLTGVTGIAGASKHSLAVRNDGTVWSWGSNEYGQLGIDSLTDSAVPMQVLNLTGITSVTAGGASSLARKSDGSLRGWGLNDTGLLGYPVLLSSPVPVIIQK